MAIVRNAHGKGVVPEIADISMSCPNKHYVPVNLEHFEIKPDNTVFIATSEFFGRIECTVGR